MLKKGLESIWIIGDEFVHHLSRVFIQIKDSLFIPKNFETRITSEAAISMMSNAVGRIVNSVIRTFNNNRETIPKWIVIVPEDNLLTAISYDDFGVSGRTGSS